MVRRRTVDQKERRSRAASPERDARPISRGDRLHQANSFTINGASGSDTKPPEEAAQPQREYPARLEKPRVFH